MIAIVSPSRNMRSCSVTGLRTAKPRYPTQTMRLAKALAGYSPWELESLLRVSPRLALQAHLFYEDFDFDAPGSPALLSYSGLAYQHLGAHDFTLEDFEFADSHLRIISAFYGLLCPTDGISPYRLELISRLKMEGKSLYAFWGDSVCRNLFAGGDAVVNLCSGEYTKAVLPYLRPEDTFISCRFLVAGKAGKLTCLATASKTARGQMARYIVKNRIQSPEKLKDFHEDGYAFSPELSDSARYIFVRV